MAATAAAVLGLLALAAGSAEARPGSAGDTVDLTLIVANIQPGVDAIVKNFERVNPNVRIDVTNTPSLAVEYQLTLTELAAGSAPDLIQTYPGCGLPISVCSLAGAGHLVQLTRAPWVRWSLPLVTSMSKSGKGLFMFSPSLSFLGDFTNDDLFRKLGLQVPQTFSQLLATCAKAKAAGVVPMLLPAKGSNVIQQLLAGIALTTVYAKDPQWGPELKAGKVSFDGTIGWHQALAEFVEMGNAGCFQPGPAGLTTSQGDAVFAQGNVLMYPILGGHYGGIESFGPQFAFSQHPFPSGDDPDRTTTEVNVGFGFGVNSRSSPERQAAARAFVDFLARPGQDALYARLTGGVTQYQLLHGQLPAYLSSFAPVLKARHWAINPVETWWNPDVGLTLSNDGLGLITGQTTIDQTLKDMDAAWKEGPS